MELPVTVLNGKGTQSVSYSKKLEEKESCTNTVHIWNPYDARGDPITAKTVPVFKATGLWDTGCSQTSIDERVAKELNLYSVGKTTITTAGGEKDAYVYLASLRIDEKWAWFNIPVHGADIGSSGPGVLIGMDIIRRGELAISHDIFSWCHPACGKPTDLKTKADKINAKRMKKNRKRSKVKR